MKLFPNLCLAMILSTTGFSAFAESQDSGFYLEGGISSLNIEPRFSIRPVAVDKTTQLVRLR